MDPQFVPIPPWAKQWAVQQQLRRTQLCAFFLRRGSCRDDCPFAHSASELCTKPVLRKTGICQAWFRGRCDNDACEFAHGEDDLQKGTLYKTQLCKFYEMDGHCRKEARCRHAHGEAELRRQERSAITRENSEPMKVRTLELLAPLCV